MVSFAGDRHMTYWSEIRERGILEFTVVVYLLQFLDILMTSTIEPTQEANAVMAYVWVKIGYWSVIAIKLIGSLFFPLGLWSCRYIDDAQFQAFLCALYQIVSIVPLTAICVWNLYVMLS